MKRQDIQPIYLLHRTQQTNNVLMTSYRRRCDVMTLHRHQCDIISTSCACWEGLAIKKNKNKKYSFLQSIPNEKDKELYLYWLVAELWCMVFRSLILAEKHVISYSSTNKAPHSQDLFVSALFHFLTEKMKISKNREPLRKSLQGLAIT